MSVKKDEQNETTAPHLTESPSAQSAEGFDEMGAATSKLVMDFGLGQQAPERVILEVLKQLIRENPKRIAFALNQPIHASLKRAAVLLFLVGDHAARYIMAELGEHEKALLVSCVAGLSPVPLEEQTVILKEFTEKALQASASLFGDPQFAKDITAPATPQAPSEICDQTP